MQNNIIKTYTKYAYTSVSRSTKLVKNKNKFFFLQFYKQINSIKNDCYSSIAYKFINILSTSLHAIILRSGPLRHR